VILGHFSDRSRRDGWCLCLGRLNHKRHLLLRFHLVDLDIRLIIRFPARPEYLAIPRLGPFTDTPMLIEIEIGD